MKLHATITHGELKWDNPELLQKTLESLSGEVVVRIDKRKPIRSLEQNNLYWELLSNVQEACGQDSDSLHEFFKSKFLVDRSGKFPVIGSTTKLNKAQFSQYIEKIRLFLLDFDIYFE